MRGGAAHPGRRPGLRRAAQRAQQLGADVGDQRVRGPIWWLPCSTVPPDSGADVVIAGPRHGGRKRCNWDFGASRARRYGRAVHGHASRGAIGARHVSITTSVKCAWFPGYSCGPPDTRAAFGLSSRPGVVQSAHVVTHRFPLEHAAEAYRVAATDTSALKTLVTMGLET